MEVVKKHFNICIYSYIQHKMCDAMKNKKATSAQRFCLLQDNTPFLTADVAKRCCKLLWALGA